MFPKGIGLISPALQTQASSIWSEKVVTVEGGFHAVF